MRIRREPLLLRCAQAGAPPLLPSLLLPLPVSLLYTHSLPPKQAVVDAGKPPHPLLSLRQAVRP